MIDLTPLDVRKKRGDFRQKLRGYDPEEVDTFLELVEGRMEALVKENRSLSEKVTVLQSRVDSLEGREEAVQDALVSAQALRKEVQDQAKKDARTLEDQAKREIDLLRREAEARIEGRIREADGLLKERKRALEDLERNRRKFLKAFRSLLEREIDAVEVEEARRPLEDAPLDLQLQGWKSEEVADEVADRDPDQTSGAEEELARPFEPEVEPDREASPVEDAPAPQEGESEMEFSGPRLFGGEEKIPIPPEPGSIEGAATPQENGPDAEHFAPHAGDLEPGHSEDRDEPRTSFEKVEPGTSFPPEESGTPVPDAQPGLELEGPEPHPPEVPEPDQPSARELLLGQEEDDDAEESGRTLPEPFWLSELLIRKRKERQEGMSLDKGGEPAEEGPEASGPSSEERDEEESGGGPPGGEVT